ncbi:MAG TPA: DUF4446 family protein [Bacillota bacterium]|nr:DUF4446 family protein [Bacillota bacterium]HOP68244.1 DUF4446 family protein [Bacillota bacterium]HPT33114.1 DUF4446 family protein [Bacillota bacterium]HPZ64651.1 DUF4446 family protein [Bacillota bacterium]HQD05182.1 DUF4446 family protein [Bacillota bacterium]
MYWINTFWETISAFVGSSQAEIFVGLVLALVLISLALVALGVAHRRLHRRYRRLVMGREGLDLETLLHQYGSSLESIQDELKQIHGRLQEMEKRAASSISGVGMVRYNAFQDTGSDLSFSLALLDQNRDGVVITSIYGREETRTYGKPIRRGDSSYHLSEEEKAAIQEAVKKLST